MKNIKDMTLKEKIGQLLVIGFQGYEYNDHLKEMIEEYKAGNIILFSRNIQDINQLYNLNKKVYQEITNSTGILPFVTIDQEGGVVTRIMQEATFFPGNMTLAATNSANALRVGEMMGHELLTLGINFNLAPVLDVNNNPLNPVIGVRSYSDDPNVVSEFGTNYIAGLQKTGVIATAKHFPGHGDTATDSHYSMTIVPHDKNRLEKIELVPFKAAIKSGIDAIMSAHVLFPAFEPDELPATLSYRVLTDLLRKELAFDGLIISDCLEMKAIDDYFTTEKAAVMGVEAGLDLLCISHTLEKQRQAAINLEKAFLDGKIPMTVLDEKVERILFYKNKIKQLIENHFLEKEYEESYELLIDIENKNVAQEIVDNSLTLIQGEIYKAKSKTLLIAPDPFPMTIAEDDFSSRSIIDLASKAMPYVDTIKIEVNPTKDEINKIINKAMKYDQIVVCTYNANTYKSQVDLIKRINLLEKDLHVILTRNPYDYLKVKNVKNIVSLYEYTPNAIRTIIKYLKGQIIPDGKLPVNIKHKPLIGASVYIGLSDYPLSRNLEYLNILHKHGIKRVFVSAHIPEMNDNYQVELKEVLKKANDLGLEVILDVSKNAWEKLDFKPQIYSLRLDYGFSDEDIIELVNNEDFLIELNASTVTLKQLQYLSENIDFGKIRISFNFYPKKYTGMSHSDVIDRLNIFKKYDLTTMAYIPAGNKRPPIYEGLPTIETHRDSPLETNVMELYLMGVDEIFFGDSFVTEEELTLIKDYDYNLICLPIIVKKNLSKVEKEILNKTHQTRLDESEYLIRSVARHNNDINSFNTVARIKGFVTIDNNDFGRYRGELNIVKRDLPLDKRTNVVGRVVCSDFLLSHLTPGTKFKLIIKGEEE